MNRSLKLTVPLAALTLISAAFAQTSASASARAAPPKETPLSSVEALHSAFGKHDARALHTKGTILEGTFTPSAEARSIVKEPIFNGGPLPIVARFSLFAGDPDTPDNVDSAAPAGFSIKVKANDGDNFDVQTIQKRDFIVSTSDEFTEFFRALGASKSATSHPTPVEQFIAAHPHTKEFLGSRTYPASFAEGKFFGINSEKFTNAAGKSSFIRYQFVPKAGEHYLSPEERKTKSANYLQDDIAQRVAKGPVEFEWYAQIASEGDAIQDPAVAWPDTRKLVKLGTISLNRVPTGSNLKEIDRTLVFLVANPHPGVEPADPMLLLRNTADPISLGQRQ